MRYFFGLLLPLLLASSTLFAQAVPAAPAPAPPLAAAPAPAVADSGAVLIYNAWYLPAYKASTPAADTTGALLSLFRKRRYAGWVYAAPFVVGMSLALPIASTNRYGQRQVASEAISPPIGSAVLVGTLVGFIIHASKFSKARLVAVDHAYAAGQAIPRKYRTQLNASHFTEAALLREALAQQQAREQRR